MELPPDFVNNIFIPIPKSSKAVRCEDHRTISLISHTAKTVLNLIKNRIAPIIEQQLSGSQYGFRADRGTRDAICQLRIMAERCLEMQKTLYICFIDYTKAFDIVKHDLLFEILLKAGVPDTEINIIKNLYLQQKATLRYENETSQEITIKRGVRQGFILSPCLFNIYTEYLIREALEDEKGININGQNITNIRYADDTIILAESEQQLQSMIDKLGATCEQYGMAMNARKTKSMIVEKTPEKQCEVNVKGQRLTQVKQYKYLGTTVENTGQCKTEVANRINQAKVTFWKKATILRSNISIKTRIRILMCYVFSVVSYGCETWTYSKAIDHKINAFEMWCYRRMLRISWTSHTTNIDVLQKIGVKETPMLNNVKHRKLSYAGHIMRNTSGHYDTLLTILEGRLEGKTRKRETKTNVGRRYKRMDWL